MDYNKIVAANIRKLRRRAGMSQEHLANLVGMSPQHLSKIERCMASPRVDTIVRIAARLDVSPARFFDPLDFDSAVYVYTDID